MIEEQKEQLEIRGIAAALMCLSFPDEIKTMTSEFNLILNQMKKIFSKNDLSWMPGDTIAAANAIAFILVYQPESLKDQK